MNFGDFFNNNKKSPIKIFKCRRATSKSFAGHIVAQGIGQCAPCIAQKSYQLEKLNNCVRQLFFIKNSLLIQDLKKNGPQFCSSFSQSFLLCYNVFICPECDLLIKIMISSVISNISCLFLFSPQHQHKNLMSIIGQLIKYLLMKLQKKKRFLQ